MADKPLVGIIMGSKSDMPTMEACTKQLEELGVPYELVIASAHRNPAKVHEWASTAADRGLKVIIAAAGKAGVVDARFVRPGQLVLDVGIHVGPDGKLCGDVDFAAVQPLAGAISPVPGGVGLMTRAMLMENTLLAARMAAGQMA